VWLALQARQSFLVWELEKFAWDASWQGAGFGFGDWVENGHCIARLWVQFGHEIYD
jgi:hypothetical protein